MAVTDVKVDHIFSISALNTDGKRFPGMEGKGHQSASIRLRVTAQKTSIDLKLQQSRGSCIKPTNITQTFVFFSPCMQLLEYF
jgi:hypothetical protein